MFKQAADKRAQETFADIPDFTDASPIVQINGGIDGVGNT